VSIHKDLGSIVRDSLPVYKAPQSLREFARQHAPSDDAAVTPRVTRLQSAGVAKPFLYAAGIAVAFLGGLTADRAIHSNREASASRNALVAELVDNHIRSLIGDHLTDVRSTDQHTVKPWFAGKIDFAPRVVDLTAKGFPLLGGRVDYVHGHTTAALAYGRRRHIVNLFIWPSGRSDDGVQSEAFNGYSLKHWTADGMSYWLVSDAAAADLDAFRIAYIAGG
jgi:anti-sigma factor RsiW